MTDNFIPELWSANIARALSNVHRFASIATREYEGQIRQAGDTVKVNAINDPDVNTYTKNTTTITLQDLIATQRELKVDQSKYIGWKVDDIDQVQNNVNVFTEATTRAGYKFADTADIYLAGLYTQAGHSQNSDASPVDLTSLNVEEEILALKELMNENKFPERGRFIICAPWVISKIILAGLTTKTQNDTLYETGRVNNVLGFNIIESNNVSNGGSWAQTRNVAGVAGMSFAYVEQIMKLEAFRPEGNFSDAIKALHVYGGKVMRPDVTVTWYADKTAEA